MNYEIDMTELNKGLRRLEAKLGSAVKEDVIKKGLSQGSLLMARWSRDNRFANLNSNRKMVLPDKLTARTAGGYRDRIFGQPPSEVQKSGNEYIAKFGTNINRRGFSYPRLHEFGGVHHPIRAVLTPAIQNQENRQAVVNILTRLIGEALEKNVSE